MASSVELPALRGGLLALLAATLFGISTPLVQRLGAGIGPFATAAPYNVIVVALDEDPTVRLVGNLVDEHGSLTGIDPDSIVIGEPVRVVFDPVTDEIAMPRWVRV